MNDREFLLLVCGIVVLVGCLAMWGIVFFGSRLFQRSMQRYLTDNPLLERMFQFWGQSGQKPNLPRYLADSYAEYLQRRNEFWTTYAQVLIAALIIIILSLLLLTHTISAEAGLPILSAVSGFAIAKGATSNRSAGSSDRDQL
jgi:uncharacterized protein YneF (UPF0154 family)